MSSVRELKKDIDNQIFEVISDCFIYAGIHPDDAAEEISKIISESVALRNDLIARVNNPDGKDNAKLVKQHYRLIEDDLNTGVDKLCAKLSAISKKKKK
jgi:hypothetical protein